MTNRLYLRSLASAGLVLAAVTMAACSGGDGGTTDPPDGPTTGTIAVSATTTGDDQDANGYSVMLDGTDKAAIGANESVNLSDVSPGNRSVALSGVAQNCSVGGEHPRSVSVTAGATAPAAFEISCVAAVGSIEVTVSTTGDGTDPDGYLVSVDGGAGEAIDANGSVTVADVAAGMRQVALGGAASNCQVLGSNPQSVDVPAGGQAQVAFSVSCMAPPPGKIAFLSSRDGVQLEVYVMNGAGGGVTRVTEMAEVKWAPAARLSPDGTRILFVTEDPPDLWVVNTDGTGLLNLTNSPEEENPSSLAWSPDGTRIAYAVGSEGDTGLWVMNSDGSGRTQLSDMGADYLDWTPDGTRIAFQAVDPVLCCDSYIWSMNSDGSGLEQLSEGSDRHPHWSPDGTRIAFLRSAAGGGSDLWMMNADGTNPHLIVSQASRIAWSPDGTRIAFSGVGLETVRPDGSGRLQLVDMNIDSRSGYPYWSPDGSTIAFMSYPNGVLGEPRDIFTIKPDGTGLTNITNHPAADEIGSWGP